MYGLTLKCSFKARIYHSSNIQELLTEYFQAADRYRYKAGFYGWYAKGDGYSRGSTLKPDIRYLGARLR